MMSECGISIFVSRPLGSEADIRTYGESIDAHLDAFSLIKFSPLSFTIPTDQWLFFYSKSGVRFFFEQLEPISDLNRYKYASFGPATGKYLEGFLRRPLDYSGDAITKDVSSALLDIVKEDSICFVVGRQSLRSVQSQLPITINSSEIIVYDNQAITDISLHHYDVAIITSPMNARTFISAGGSADHYISIGPTTSEAMVMQGLQPAQAPDPSEAGLHTILKSVYKDYYYGKTK